MFTSLLGFDIYHTTHSISLSLAPAPPERPRRRYVENPEIPAEPNFDAKNSWKRRFAGKPELPTEPNFDAQNKQNEKYNGNSKMTAQPNFNAKNSWKSSVSNPK